MSKAAVPLPALPVFTAPKPDPLQSVPLQPAFVSSLDLASPDIASSISAVVVSQENSGLSPGAELSKDIAAPPVETTDSTLQENPISSFVLYGGLVLAAFVIFFACTGRISDWRRKRQENAILTDFVPDSAPLEKEEEEEEEEREEQETENAEIETTVAIKESEESIEDQDAEKNLEKEFFDEKIFDKEISDEEIFDRDTFDRENLNAEISPFETQDPLPEKLGFDRVYSLLNQALVSIDATQVVTTPAISDKLVQEPALPNLADAVEVLDNLVTMFGQSFLLETLKEEVLKALELKEGTPILQTKDMVPEYFVLKLCCNTLLNMLQTGRYHIGKGILSNEGQELVNLFARINDLRTREAYSSREEAEKDAAFMQFCVRELG
jgi:hypothetical protein